MEKITKNMPLAKVISKYPQTAEIFMKNGLHCIGCGIAAFETIEQGAKAHGIKTDKLLKELNNSIKNAKTNNK